MAWRFSRWRRGPGLSTLLLLGFVSAALIGGVMLMWQTIMAERQQREQAARTTEVLMALRDISRTAVNGETGQRGYMISLDRRYLTPYLVARQQVGGNIARLRGLVGTAPSPRQRALLGEIERLNAAKFAELDRSVRLVAAGRLLEARREVLTDEGQAVMERLRGSVAELEAIELASYAQARGRAIAAEARIVPLLVVLLGFIMVTLALGLVQVVRAADAEARAENAAELRRARDQADLLAGELNHRVKNLFAVVLAIVKMSGRGQPEAAPTVERIAQRIHALLTAHEVTQGTSARRSARLGDLVETALAPYRGEDHACTIAGPGVDLPEHAVVPLGLVLHELTTNAVKYGAWSQPGGHLAVDWTVADGRLRLDWCERPLVPLGAVPGGRGFGSALIDSSARQLGGTIAREFTATTIAVRIEIPLTA